jgi:hypothetical protein
VKENLGSIFAAYLVGWAVFFIFYVSIARRTSALRDEVERLRNSIAKEK